ncbi:Acetylornithine deacetylase [Poriferisphaera corsica]|uniref:Acetylornithine deacetylase n=1 Tax=Poriferisphaera corsica TaxID=2528020 RepID=A0A517YUU3_9BACT|nr:M20/M25/M40 family metallo-hydrolase [Poriferisphaera corsica]QDU33997.1 Acetylornithine deacetylase [Poriferisphaera corsica]
MIPENVVELLQVMVRCDTVNQSVSGVLKAEQRLAEILKGIAEEMGFETRYLPVDDGQADQLLVTYQVGEGKPWVWFDSHMDTVSVAGMTIEPFGGEIKDGKMWGRGTCDTKGTGACMLWAMHAYKQSGCAENNIALLFSIDEEEGMTGIRSFVRKDYEAIGIEPVGFVVGEPTKCEPIVRHNGVFRGEVWTYGKAAHSSEPENGVSAISAMARLLLKIEGEYIPTLNARDELTGKAQMSMNKILGGESLNVIPDACLAYVDRRLVPGEKAADAFREFEAFVADYTKREDEGLNYELKMTLAVPGMDAGEDERLLRGIQGVCEELGVRNEGLGVAYATHGGYLRETGQSVVVIGPGDIAQAHTKDEYVELEQIELGMKLYLGIMKAEMG